MSDLLIVGRVARFNSLNRNEMLEKTQIIAEMAIFILLSQEAPIIAYVNIALLALNVVYPF